MVTKTIRIVQVEFLFHHRISPVFITEMVFKTTKRCILCLCYSGSLFNNFWCCKHLFSFGTIQFRIVLGALFKPSSCSSYLEENLSLLALHKALAKPLRGASWCHWRIVGLNEEIIRYGMANSLQASRHSIDREVN